MHVTCPDVGNAYYMPPLLSQVRHSTRHVSYTTKHVLHVIYPWDKDTSSSYHISDTALHIKETCSVTRGNSIGNSALSSIGNVYENFTFPEEGQVNGQIHDRRNFQCISLTKPGIGNLTFGPVGSVRDAVPIDRAPHKLTWM